MSTKVRSIYVEGVRSSSGSVPIYDSPELIVVVVEGSTLGLVPSLSHLSSLWLGGPFHFWVQSQICLTWAHCVEESTLIVSPVSSLSHLSSLWWWGSTSDSRSQLPFCLQTAFCAQDWVGSLPSDDQWAKKCLVIFKRAGQAETSQDRFYCIFMYSVFLNS